MGRRTNGSGSLKIRNGIYIARWMYNGKMHERSTHIRVDMKDKHGNNCAKSAALKVLEGFTDPYKHKSEADVLAVLSSRIKAERELGAKASAYDALTLAQLPDAYENSSRRASATQHHIDSYKTILSEFAKWLGANTIASAVDEKDAVKWADYIWKSGISPRTFNMKICCMRVVWNILKPIIGFDVNPWNDIKKRKDQVHTRRPFSNEEEKILFATIGNRYGGDVRIMCRTGQCTGMRLGDCALLKWEDINFADNMIRVVTQKTGEKVNIPMVKILRDELLAHQTLLRSQYDAARKSDDWDSYWLSLPSTGQKGRVTNIVDKDYLDYVAPRMAERYLRDRTLLCAMIRKLINKAELENARKEGRCLRARPVLGFHSFRHGLASKLAEAGIPQVIAMMILGHRNATVHNAYRHVNDGFLKSEFEKLNGAL